jgi:hypothetical protein
MVTISSLPILSGFGVHKLLGADQAVINVHEAASLFAVAPILISCLPVITAIATLRETAAGAFSRPPSQVPYGPSTLW